MKEQLRQTYRRVRDELPGREQADEAILNALLRLSAYEQAKRVLLYVSMGSEVDTHRLLTECLAAGKEVCVPAVIRGTKAMEVCQIWDMDDLAPGTYGILEPKRRKCVSLDTVDLVVVPGIAFDHNGHRLGYGAGFYDRLLQGYRGVTAGLCYRACLAESVHPGPYDIPVDFVVTEQGAVRAGCK